MIGGEGVSLANKFMDAKPNEEWTAPMLANANCLPVPTLFKDKVSHPSPSPYNTPSHARDVCSFATFPTM